MIGFLQTGLAVVLGAAIAYFSQLLHERRRQRLANLASAQQTQFTLASQRNFLEIVSRHLKQFENDNDRHMKLFHLNHDVARPHIDTKSLGFILQSSQPDLLLELEICDERFLRLICAISVRNELLESRILDLLDAHDQSGYQINPNDWRLQRFKTYTDEVYKAADDALSTNVDCGEKLKTFITKQFPKSKTLRVQIRHDW